MSMQVFGISGDTPAENKAFKDAQGLPYDLLTDESNILRKEFGVPNAMFVLPGRQTYVIDKDGVCIMSFNEMVNATQHTEKALAAVGA
jgi:thioredoxin-dependent peroxiredoxin